MKKELTKELKNLLFEKTRCNIQHNGWTCGTCFFATSNRFTNIDWQTILLVRGDYKKSELDNLPKDVEKRVKRIIKILRGLK